MKISQFFSGLFLDDVGEPCLGRFAFMCGLFLLPITAMWELGSIGDVTWPEAVVRTSPGWVGLGSYFFTRLYESREFIAEIAQKLRKNG